MICPPFIPLLIAFDDSAETTMDSRVAPTGRRQIAKKNTNELKSTVRRCTLRKFSNFVNFYNAAIVKFCFHSVNTLIVGLDVFRFLLMLSRLQSLCTVRVVKSIFRNA